MAKEEDKKPENEDEELVFRPEAMRHFGSSEQFEHNLQVIRYRKWLAQFSVLILVLGCLSWVVFGYIPIEAQGVAIAISDAGLANVETAFNGIVKTLNAQAGDAIKEGDLLVTLHNPELDVRLEMANQTIQSLQHYWDYLHHQISFERIEEKQAILKNIEATDFKIKTLEQEIPILKKDTDNKKKLAALGLYDSISLQQAIELLWSTQTNLEKTKSDLASLKFKLKKEYREDELIALQDQLRQAHQQRMLLETQLRYANIYSPATGTVLNFFVQPDTYITTGELVARLEIASSTQNKIFYGYLPIGLGKTIRLGAQVEMDLTTVKSQEFGSMIGHISEISQYAISKQKLTGMINNPELVNYLVQNNAAVIEVKIEPQSDPTTFSGYKWTSGKGPPIHLTSGTLCVFKGLVEEIRPLSYLLPLWKIKKVFYQVKAKLAPYFDRHEEQPEQETETVTETKKTT